MVYGVSRSQARITGRIRVRVKATAIRLGFDTFVSNCLQLQQTKRVVKYLESAMSMIRNQRKQLFASE